MADKKDVMKVRNSRKLYVPIYFMVIVLVGAVIFIKYKGLPLNGLALILIGVFILMGLKSTEIHRLLNSYEVNPDSVVHSQGILRKKITRVDHFAISDSDVTQSLLQRILNFGTVEIHLFSRDSTTVVRNINNPAKFASFLEEKIHNKRIQADRRQGGIA